MQFRFYDYFQREEHVECCGTHQDNQQGPQIPRSWQCSTYDIACVDSVQCHQEPKLELWFCAYQRGEVLYIGHPQWEGEEE